MHRLTTAALGGACLLATACSGSAAAPTPRASHPPSSSPSAETNACSSVHTTTPADMVPVACAELWVPYQVTMIPPSDILQQEHVPAAPTVKDLTNGAVSQAEAQLFGNADNWGSGWFKWAEAHVQPFLISRLAGPANVSPSEQEALSQGAAIEQPDCNLYPNSLTL